MANPEPERLPIVFKWEGNGKKVFLAGSFNAWSLFPFEKSRDGFEAMVELPEGEHQYKLVVDGDWQHIPSKPTLTDSSGNINNVILVKKDTMKDSLKNIEQFLKTKEYNDYFNGLEDEKTVTKVQGIAAVIHYIQNISTRHFVVASIKIVEIMASAVPVYGPIAGRILSLCSAILDIIWKVNENTHSNILDDTKEKVLEAKELRSKVINILARFTASESYLRTLESNLNDINQTDIDHMMSVIDFYQGSEILEELRCTIGEGRDVENEDEANRIICLTNLYVRIAAIRSSMLWRMFSILSVNGPEVSLTSNVIQNVIKEEDEKHKQFLLLLIEPDYKTINLLTVLNPTEQIDIASFVRSFGLQFQRLRDFLQGEFSIKSVKSNEFRLIMSCNVWGSVWGSHTPNKNQNLFRFQEVSTEDNIFTIFSIRWPSWYVYMQRNRKCRGYMESTREIGPQAKWKILRLKNGHFVMSPIEWPCSYAYISHSGFSFLTRCDGKPSESDYLVFESKEK